MCCQSKHLFVCVAITGVIVIIVAEEGETLRLTPMQSKKVCYNKVITWPACIHHILV